MRQDRNYFQGKKIFKDVQITENLESDFNENQMIGPINKRHLHKAAANEHIKGGLAYSQKPSSSANGHIITGSVQRNPVHHAPYSEIYNMVVMRETY